MDYEYETLDAAREALDRAIEDAKADFGDEAGESVDVVTDLIRGIAMDCSPEVEAELWRTELGLTPNGVPVWE
jgi:hypothetical protein